MAGNRAAPPRRAAALVVRRASRDVARVVPRPKGHRRGAGAAALRPRRQHPRRRPAHRRRAPGSSSSASASISPRSTPTASRSSAAIARGRGAVRACRYRFEYAERRKNVALFVSRYGHCLHDLLWRHRARRAARATIRAGHLEPPRPRGRRRALRHPVPRRPGHRRTTSARGGRSSCALVRRRTTSTSSCSPATCRSSRPSSSSAYRGRIINIHHSFLPAFVGAAALPPGARARREAHRRDGALRDRGPRRGPDHRAGRRARLAPRRRRRPGPQGPRPREDGARPRGARCTSRTACSSTGTRPWSSTDSAAELEGARERSLDLAREGLAAFADRPLRRRAPRVPVSPARPKKARAAPGGRGATGRRDDGTTGRRDDRTTGMEKPVCPLGRRALPFRDFTKYLRQNARWGSKADCRRDSARAVGAAGVSWRQPLAAGASVVAPRGRLATPAKEGGTVNERIS